jgi:hypothetical protein
VLSRSSLFGCKQADTGGPPGIAVAPAAAPAEERESPEPRDLRLVPAALAAVRFRAE